MRRNNRKDRPFDKKILAKARQIATQYRFVIEPHPDVGFFGRVIEMPGVMADGETQAACLEDLRFAVEMTLATMLESGRRLPLPSSEARRREQVNIRVTPEERVLLAEESTRRGYRGVSEFVRTIVLRACNVNV